MLLQHNCLLLGPACVQGRSVVCEPRIRNRAHLPTSSTHACTTCIAGDDHARTAPAFGNNLPSTNALGASPIQGLSNSKSSQSPAHRWLVVAMLIAKVRSLHMYAMHADVHVAGGPSRQSTCMQQHAGARHLCVLSQAAAAAVSSRMLFVSALDLDLDPHPLLHSAASVNHTFRPPFCHRLHCCSYQPLPYAAWTAAPTGRTPQRCST